MTKGTPANPKVPCVDPLICCFVCALGRLLLLLHFSLRGRQIHLKPVGKILLV